MHFVVLSVVAGSMLAASVIPAGAVEMVKPFEALEQTRRFNLEFEKRQKREKAEQRSQEKEQESKRKQEEAEQRRRERENKAQQKAQVKRDAATAKSVAPSLAAQSAPTATPQAATQAAEPQSQVQSSPTSPQVNPEASAPPPSKPSTAEQVDEPRPHAPSEPPASPVQAQGELRERVQGGNPPPITTGNAVAAPMGKGNAVAVSRLVKMDLHNERGDRLGDIERVVQSADGRFHIVIGTGGFLGMREHDVRIPLDDEVTIRGDRLVIKGLTDEQVKAMPAFDSSDRGYRNIARSATVRMVRDRSED
jgi:flagellar biosynthesis GTPase FlhF